jgi:1-acyl-sn-glycerol-3-phosphate acyltransferase
LGGIALPNDPKGFKNYSQAMKQHAKKGHIVALYPEAHIWPQYTGIRPFKPATLHYPAESGKPVFTFTTTWQKRKILPGARTVVYVDGPFIPDMNLPMDKRKEALRDQALEAMTRRAKNSNYEKIHYVYRPKDDEGAASENACTDKRTSKEDPTEA